MCAAGPITTPKGAFQHAVYWLLPVAQPTLTLLAISLAIFPTALAGAAALHHLPYVAPLLLLPALWLVLLTLTLLIAALAKWLLLGRAKPTSYAKYSWAFQTKAINGAIGVRRIINSSSPLLSTQHAPSGVPPPWHQGPSICDCACK